MATLAALLALALHSASAATPVAYDRPSIQLGREASQNAEARYYYAIEDVAQAQVIQRGFSSLEGIVRDGVILRPETLYRFWLLHESKLQGHVDLVTPRAGERFTIPRVSLGSGLGLDADSDGLDDDVEFILGTNPNTRDTDGDGLNDGATFQLGLNPGAAARTGITASTDTQGNAVDVCAFNDIAVVADSSEGVVVFNVQGRNPIRIAQVNTPGTAQAVACSGNLIAVADGPVGVVIVDVSDPAAARITSRVPLVGHARAVAAAGALAFVGTEGGQVAVLDMLTGIVEQRLQIGATVEDVAVGADHLYVLLAGELRSFDLSTGVPQPAGSVALSGFIPERIGGRKRLFVGSSHAFVTSYPGYDVIDIRNPASLVRVAVAAEHRPNSFKQIVDNGSGLGVAAVGDNPRDDGTHDVYLYDVSNPSVTTNFGTILTTPGVAYAVSLYNGLAYVADGPAGLQVMNYLAFDTRGNAPTIRLTNSFNMPSSTNGVVEEGAWVRSTALVSDDVQVRNVEFYIDGVRQVVDGNFPFEYRFVTPLRTGSRPNFLLQAKATDTGGNATWSLPIRVALLPDGTPPRVVSVFPSANSILGAVSAANARFSEPIDPDTLNLATFRLKSAGTNEMFGDQDDFAITNGVLSYRNDDNTAILAFSTNLPPGHYEATIHPPLADLAGNVIRSLFVWRFWILGGRDTDQDGLPDFLEMKLQLEPDNPSTLNDGVLDGDRDSDGDGLTSKWELRFGYNPTLRSTTGDDISDGEKDPDLDGLTNVREQLYGTLPHEADSDSDRWNDETEVAAGSNPNDATSRPLLRFAAPPPLRVTAPGLGTTDGLPPNTLVARPPIRVTAPAVGSSDGLPPNTLVARPPIRVTAPAVGSSDGLPANTRLAAPPVRVNFEPQ